MAKSKTNRRSKSRRGGAPVFVGSSWAPAASNMHRDLTAPSAIGNYFKPSPYGVPGGGFQPPVPEMNGPDRYQINKLSPPVGLHRGGLKRSRSTHKRSKRSRSRSRSGSRRGKRGGYSLGGFPQLGETAWDNAIVGIKNVVNGFNGTSQLTSASPWVQPELTKPPNIPLAKPIDIVYLKTAAAQRVANV
jgi:hypothetical protein